MIAPSLATIAIIASALFLLVIIPLLDGSHKFGKYISLRYTLVVVALTMALGCILDFSFLIESSRNIVLCGGLVLTGLFVVFRSLEKCKLGARTVNITAKKGDIELSATMERDNKTKIESETEKGESDGKE